MKLKNLKNLLALLLALVLALSCCAGFAETAADEDAAGALDSEEEAAAGEESQTQFFDDTLISSLDMTTSDWMLNGQTQALFAVLLMLEVATCDDPEVVALMDDCSVPELYITSSLNTDTDLDAIVVFYFLKKEQRLVQAMYVPLLNQFTASITEVTVDPELLMDALQAKGLFSDYQHISFADYSDALNALSEAVNSN